MQLKMCTHTIQTGPLNYAVAINGLVPKRPSPLKITTRLAIFVQRAQTTDTTEHKASKYL